MAHPIMQSIGVGFSYFQWTDFSKRALQAIPYGAILSTPAIWTVWIASIGNFTCVNMMFLFSPKYLSTGESPFAKRLRTVCARLNIRAGWCTAYSLRAGKAYLNYVFLRRLKWFSPRRNNCLYIIFLVTCLAFPLAAVL